MSIQIDFSKRTLKWSMHHNAVEFCIIFWLVCGRLATISLLGTYFFSIFCSCSSDCKINSFEQKDIYLWYKSTNLTHQFKSLRVSPPESNVKKCRWRKMVYKLYRKGLVCLFTSSPLCFTKRMVISRPTWFSTFLLPILPFLLNKLFNRLHLIVKKRWSWKLLWFILYRRCFIPFNICLSIYFIKKLGSQITKRELNVSNILSQPIFHYTSVSIPINKSNIHIKFHFN